MIYQFYLSRTFRKGYRQYFFNGGGRKTVIPKHKTILLYMFTGGSKTERDGAGIYEQTKVMLPVNTIVFEAEVTAINLCAEEIRQKRLKPFYRTNSIKNTRFHTGQLKTVVGLRTCLLLRSNTSLDPRTYRLPRE